jgi:ribulose-5-phosphate 4-epimerase/fuculose-1-phosphate aldolase
MQNTLTGVTPLSKAEAQRQLIQVGQELKTLGLLFLGEHANLSARTPEGILLTRGGSISHLDENSFALVDLEGQVLEGELIPQMREVVAMHTEVYRARPEVGAVLHTHPPFATSFAVAHQPIPLVYEPLLRFGFTAPIPVVPWAPRGSRDSVEGILREAARGGQAVLLANHGVLVWGATPTQALGLMARLEEAATLTLRANLLGGARPLDERAIEEVEARMQAFGSR